MGEISLEDPCMRLCRFDDAGWCLGCRRSRAEVKAWKRLPDQDKARINRRILPLIAAAPSKKAARRRLRLDKRIRKLEKKLARLRRRQQSLGPQPGSERPGIEKAA
ncbi:MAG: DUF1289 domain-containing protein [Azospirillum sp.]|nr:DUF1289 domain-containing protein [Azospirillum sp.]